MTNHALEAAKRIVPQWIARTGAHPDQLYLKMKLDELAREEVRVTKEVQAAIDAATADKDKRIEDLEAALRQCVADAERRGTEHGRALGISMFQPDGATVEAIKVTGSGGASGKVSGQGDTP